MAKNKKTNFFSNQSRHYKGFWPIFLVIIIGLIASGTIYAFAYGNQLQDDVNSVFFTFHSKVSEKPIQKTTNHSVVRTPSPVKK